MKDNKLKFVGFYHYGVLLTYLSVAAAVAGSVLSVTVAPVWGAVCLLISGVCSAFDGAVASTRKNRGADDKNFGEQINSLSNLVAFGFAPIMISLGMGMTKWYFIVLYALYLLCALIRLAYFNVTGEVKTKDDGRNVYEGLPVVNIAVILPVFYLVATCFTGGLIVVRYSVMALCYVLAGFLFLFRFRMAKLGVKGLIITMFVLAVIIAGVVVIRYTVLDIPLF